MAAIRLEPDHDWFAGVQRLPSPNHDQRPAGITPDLLVIHGISLPPGIFAGDAIDRLFTNRLDPTAHPYFLQLEGLRVSSHLLIRRDGAVTQYVGLKQRAWHAGVSSFEGRPRCNDYSIGIELEGTDDIPYTDAQYRVLQAVAVELRAAFPRIGPARAVGHADVAPGRKTDPGPAFDWPRFRAGWR